MNNQYTNEHRGFLTLIEEDWDKTLLDDSTENIDKEYIEEMDD